MNANLDRLDMSYETNNSILSTHSIYDENDDNGITLSKT